MSALDPYSHLVVSFGNDMTLRWSCRKGDMLLWMRWTNVFADPETAVSILDLWEMRDGDHVTITSRVIDLPNGFRLHPTEVKGSLVSWMMKKINEGYNPEEPMEGPNIWRLRGGDRLVWVGNSRPGQRGTDSILAILDCEDCALAVGETNRITLEDLTLFGSPSKDTPKAEEVTRGNRAVKIVRAMGLPRVLFTEWRLG